MWIKKWKEEGAANGLLNKFLALVVLSAAALLLLNVLQDDRDGRQQIVDEDGGEEVLETGLSREELRLQGLLETMKDVGRVSVRITLSEEKGTVQGVAVSAEGAGSPVVKSRILDTVSALYSIGVEQISVFERQAGL
ncbi:MAG: hypothetical protein E7223_02545 [Clostridiales bacterium]|nr:hypothetical protein [Clostridiales bacterium]